MKTSWLARAFLLAVSVLIGVALVELALRVRAHEVFTFTNFLATRSLLKSAYPTAFDAELGWVPAPGYSGVPNVFRTQVTILPDSLRANGQARPIAGPVILAVGDSFTFGDQVSDRDSWPAQLERALEVPVMNGGVFGYGIDQSVLRARRLLPTVRPALLIVSLIDDDINRAELSRRTNVEKPYFEVVAGRLVLRNSPVVRRERATTDDFRRVIGYSLLAHQLLSRLAPDYWFSGADGTKRAHHDGTRVACLLMKELEQLGRDHAARVLVLAQDELRRPSPLACLDGTGVRAFEMAPILDRIKSEDFARHGSLFFDRANHSGHMTAAGNAVVTAAITPVVEAMLPR